MKKTILFSLCIFILVAGVYIFIQNKNQKTINKVPSDIKQLVSDYSQDKKSDGSASITSDELIITKENGEQIIYSLPEDEFFVSIAPYIHQTHECAIHSLTGCQGELVNEEFDVRVEDKNGKVIIDKKMKSYSNGFIDLWLPRNNEYHVVISYDGKKAESKISTFKDDKTCITTMQLM